MTEPSERDERRSQLSHRDAMGQFQTEHVIDERNGDVTIYDDPVMGEWITAAADSVVDIGGERE